jgi:hypothetical protein
MSHPHHQIRQDERVVVVVVVCEQDRAECRLFLGVVDVTRNAKNGFGLVFTIVTIWAHCDQAM